MTMVVSTSKRLVSAVAVACLGLSVVAVSTDDVESGCRSNATHIAWPCPCEDDSLKSSSARSWDGSTASVDRRRVHQSTTWCSCQIQTIREAQEDAYSYLRSHVMDFDLPFLGTLGFDDDDINTTSSTAGLPDGLGGGMIGPTIEYALLTKVLYPYADRLPRHIWQEYVLNYASANEARTNWRPILHKKLSDLVPHNGTDISAAVLSLNRDMWTALAPQGTTDRIVFVGSQTPLIFDTMSVLVFGYASCTGLAILFVNALRSVGVPSRLVGTPAWHQDRDSGNHNWLEVYHDGEWKFLEPTAIRNPLWVDGIDVDPCRRWFCDKSRFPDDNSTLTTKVYAARLERPTPSSYYPLAWEWGSTAVPGEDVSESYQRTCSKCP
jgi:Transglutaminase-like superfamily